MEKYFKFSGTAIRSEYWGVFFINMAMLAIATLAGTALGGMGDVSAFFGAALVIAALVAYIWVLVATTVRRCRDADINPWFTALIFVPYVAVVVNILFGCLPSKKSGV